MALNFEPDFFILSIIDKEFKALMNVFPLSERIPHEGRDYYQGQISTENGTYSIVATQSFGVGNTTSSSTTSAVLQHFKPKFFLLVGIAGGVDGRKNLELGDVVVSTNVKYYELEKESGGKVEEIFATLANPSRTLLNTCRWLSETKWWEELRKKPQGGNTNPKQISGLILSGERLLGDPVSEFLKQLLEKVPKALAVEMEGGGVATAIYDNSAHNKVEYLAIRGISDFCNKDGNQETRDTWREYSSTSAAVFARKIMENTLIDREPTDPKGKYILQFDKNLPQQSPKEFNLQIETNEGVIDSYSFFEEVSSNRKVLLKGYAGGGKSELVRRLATHLIAEGKTPVVINLNNFSALSEEFKKGENVDARMKTLLKASPVSPSIELIESFNQPYRIIIDGLNEITGGTYGNEMPRLIVSTLEDFLLDHQEAGMVITDRLTERNFFSAWKEMTLLPLDKESVSAIIDVKFGESTFSSLSEKNQEILKTPYFLDYALRRESPTIISEAIALEDFFKNVLGFDDDKIDELSKIVFTACEKTQGLLILQEHMDSLGDNAAKLMESGTINKSEQGYTFDHQLKHEYLISRHLAKNEKNWGIIGLDVATLGASSIDSLFMTTEQLENKEACDKFLLQVFNWNWRAAIRCITRLENKGSSNYSEYTLIAMAALVAQKKFDSVHGTHREAIASLDGIKNENCKKMAAAGNLDDIIGIVNGISNGEDWFTNWRDIFTWDSAKIPSDDEMMKIKSEESTVGWTSSNALKRLALNDIHQGQLRIMYLALLEESPLNSTVRWRIAHTLGSFPSKVNAELLFKVIENDTYHWAKFGAARSLVEMAAKTNDSTLRKTIIDYFTQHHKTMHDAVREEIGKASMYHNAFGDWENSIRPLLEGIGQSMDEELTKREWEKIMNRFNDGEWKTR